MFIFWNSNWRRVKINKKFRLINGLKSRFYQDKIVGQGTHKELMKDNKYYIDIQTNNYSSSNKQPEEIIVTEENKTEFE